MISSSSFSFKNATYFCPNIENMSYTKVEKSYINFYIFYFYLNKNNMSCPNEIKGVFIHINKCGGTSIKSILNKKENVIVCTNNIPGSKVNINEIQKWAEYENLFSFTIIRHPFSRFISAYKMIKRDCPELNYTLNKFINIVTDPKISYLKTKIDKNFAYYAWGGPEVYIKRHTLPLSHSHYGIVDENENIKVKFIGKLENIENDWKIIQQKLEINEKISVLNSTKKEEIKLNDEQKKILFEYYKKDFEFFSYDLKLINNNKKKMNLENIKKIIAKKKEIPKIIHQIWIGPNPVPFIWINTWRFEYIKKNPEWKYILWDNENIKNLKYLDIIRYEKEKTWNGKSDFLRFAILKEHGGVYIDADSVSIEGKSLDSLIEESKGNFFAAWEDHEGIKKTIAGGVCGSPINHYIVDKIIDIQTKRWDQYHLTLAPWQTVGPLAVQQGVEESNFKNCVIFPSKHFYPEWWHHYSEHFTTIDMKKFKDSYMYQFGYSTNGYAYSDSKNKLEDLKNYSKNINPNFAQYEFSEDLIIVCKNDEIDLEIECQKFINSKEKIYFIDNKSYITHSIYLKEIKEKGFTFLIRAKNEEKNVKNCLESLLPSLNHFIEIIFVDNGSTDKTYEIALEYSDKVKVFKYSQEIEKTGEKYYENIQKNPEKSIAKFYNWCVEKSTKNIIIKWDADFILNEKNFEKMLLDFNLYYRKDNFIGWFTGETIFEHKNKLFKKTNSFYDEFRIFNKKYTKWNDGIKCEYLEINPNATKLKFDLPLFYEIKRTSLDEFSNRGDVIDRRDIDDKNILEKIIRNETDDSQFFSITEDFDFFNKEKDVADKFNVL